MQVQGSNFAAESLRTASVHILNNSAQQPCGTRRTDPSTVMYFLFFPTFLALAMKVAGSPTPPSPPRNCYLPKRLIALEEHVVSPSLEAEVIASGVANRSAPGTLDKLKDVGPGRIAAMDEGMLSLMVLSQQSASGLENVE
jgi:hypothetical protein